MRRTGAPVLIRDTQQEPDWIPMDGLVWVRSFLSAPLLIEKKVIGFVNLFGDQPGFFTEEMSKRLIAFAAHAGVAIQNAWLFEQVQASTERLQSLSRRLVEVQENERLYISRELHDEAGQVLTSLLVDLKLLENNASNPKAILKIVTEMECSLNGVIENLHRIAIALRPASLDHVGLVAALRQHVESVGEKHGIRVSFSAGGVDERLPSNVETVLYRIVQEALTNIVRHAHATRADVVLTIRDGKLIVIVEDDGIGFDQNTFATGDHLGLFGIRERTEMIDGKLTIESAPGKGTTIIMEVGYADQNHSGR
jgi:signal transduction histidine kinase